MNIIKSFMAEILEKRKIKLGKKEENGGGRKRDSRNTHSFLKDEVEDTLNHNI